MFAADLPDRDPDDPGSKDPPPTAAKNAATSGWTEQSSQGDVYRNVGYGSAWVGNDPHSIDNNIPPRTPLSPEQFKN